MCKPVFRGIAFTATPGMAPGWFEEREEFVTARLSAQ